MTRWAIMLPATGWAIDVQTGSKVVTIKVALDDVDIVPVADPDETRGIWCGVSSCRLAGVRKHGHDGRYGPGEPTPWVDPKPASFTYRQGHGDSKPCWDDSCKRDHPQLVGVTLP